MSFPFVREKGEETKDCLYLVPNTNLAFVKSAKGYRDEKYQRGLKVK